MEKMQGSLEQGHHGQKRWEMMVAADRVRLLEVKLMVDASVQLQSQSIWECLDQQARWDQTVEVAGLKRCH